MLLLTAIVLIISILEFRIMIKKKYKKDMVIFTAIALLTLAIGYFYTENPNFSLASYLLKLLE